MSSIEPKKMAVLRILQILQEYSDCDHPLTHEEIAKKLDYLYGIELERKAIGRHINDLINIFSSAPSKTLFSIYVPLFLSEIIVI